MIIRDTDVWTFSFLVIDVVVGGHFPIKHWCIPPIRSGASGAGNLDRPLIRVFLIYMFALIVNCDLGHILFLLIVQ